MKSGPAPLAGAARRGALAAFARPLAKPPFAARPAKAMAGVFCLGLLNASPGFGVDYAFQAASSLQQNYNTNLLMRPSSQKPPDAWGSELEMTTNFSAATRTWMASGGARFDNWFYYPVTGMDMQNQYVDGQLSYFTERSRYDLAGNFISDALLSSHTDQTDTQGVIFGRIPRELKSISPSWNYKLSEYTNVNLDYSYSDSKYPASASNQGATYPDSITHSLSSAASHQASEHLLLDGSLSVTDYSTQSIQQRSIDYVSMMAGIKYDFSANTHIAVSGGGQYTQTTVTGTGAGRVSQKSSQFGPLFNISASQAFDNSTLGVIYGHTISPSINGSLFTSDSASLNATRKFSERLGGVLRVSYFSSSYTAQSGTFGLQSTAQGQNTYQFGTDLSYALAKNCTLSAAYSYKLRDLANGTGAYAGTQDAHIMSLSLRYNFEPLHY